ncbi:PQQ-dependent sugar dehydrogenase [Maribacter hydrothermalis]|uniref:Sorbosone dehydrogenase n=1 Tax=Maribacter hydrothermalis TaxID=1836467 RepID=A0A1B7Z4F1_9FLAO|nr:PQQ-dependent sugar dehydrogenase [Maribacter hydrothermalis]APQ17287.1 sorbosone dehydrogenase [Maribacter hydrothermalis]OBR37546.1 sorbosone dehydrogenase [Maribacter hydrothermalis]
MNNKPITKKPLRLLTTIAVATLFIQCKPETKPVVKTVSNETILKAPEGFSVSEIGKDLGAVRHLTVAKNGDIYANRSVLKDGKAIIVLKDTDNDGNIDAQQEFAEVPGTGILATDTYLYTSSNSAIFRYPLNSAQEIIDTNSPEKLIDSLIDMGMDNAKPFTVDNDKNLYVTIGSWNDGCRDGNAGMIPCAILDSAGGIWKFKTDKLNQTFSDGSRYATGLKNAVGLDWNFKTNSLFATDHGRGGLHNFYPDVFTQKQDAELPSETLYEIKEGDNAGWPKSYYDHFKNKRMLAPEYGGDGEQLSEDNYINPVAAFPAHLGPNDLLFYTGDMFPDKYKNGAFIAFHNQSAELKKGFFVAFVPFKDGKPNGDWELFLDNFAGFDLANPEGGELKHRPCGLAQGPDGALYVCDDFGGSIFKVTY